MSIEGDYIRLGGEVDSAELKVTALPMSPDRYHVMGFALWGKNREFGPNMGELDFSANLEEGEIIWSHTLGENEYCIRLRFTASGLDVEESAHTTYHGFNVTFAGHYAKS